VDVEVHRADVSRLALERAFEQGEDLLRPRARLPAREPEVPGMHVHQRFRRERCDGRVLRICRRDVAHGLRVGGVERRAVGGRLRGVALRERGGEHALLRIGLRREPRGFLRQLRRAVDGGRLHRCVDVRPEHERASPPAERARGIALLRLGEREVGGRVIEREAQHQALIEVALRVLGGRRDGEVQAAETLEERLYGGRHGLLARRARGVARGRGLCGLRVLGRAIAGDEDDAHGGEKGGSHGTPPPAGSTGRMLRRPSLAVPAGSAR